MKEIIRIEHPDSGKGIWNHEVDNEIAINYHSQYDAMSNRHCNPYKFPNFSEDTELREQLPKEYDLENYFFAFKNLEQLSSGFTKEELKECINDFGFRIYVYKTTDFFESKFQVIFIKEKALEKKDISFMFI